MKIVLLFIKFCCAKRAMADAARLFHIKSRDLRTLDRGLPQEYCCSVNFPISREKSVQTWGTAAKRKEKVSVPPFWKDGGRRSVHPIEPGGQRMCVQLFLFLLVRPTGREARGRHEEKLFVCHRLHTVDVFLQGFAGQNFSCTEKNKTLGQGIKLPAKEYIGGRQTNDEGQQTIDDKKRIRACFWFLKAACMLLCDFHIQIVNKAKWLMLQRGRILHVNSSTTARPNASNGNIDRPVSPSLYSQPIPLLTKRGQPAFSPKSWHLNTLIHNLIIISH